MSPRLPSLLAVLRLAVAALALLGTGSVHELLHCGDWATQATESHASGQLELHSGHCEHGQPAHEPHRDACLLCKGAHAHEAWMPGLCAVRASAGATGHLVADTAQHAPHADFPGTLGARGPPMTTV